LYHYLPSLSSVFAFSVGYTLYEKICPFRFTDIVTTAVIQFV